MSNFHLMVHPLCIAFWEFLSSLENLFSIIATWLYLSSADFQFYFKIQYFSQKTCKITFFEVFDHPNSTNLLYFLGVPKFEIKITAVDSIRQS